MAFETKPDTGSLFKNDRKETESHPLYKGSALIGGVEYWMDAWLNESTSGVKYMSLKFKPKESRQPAIAPTQSAELDDDFVPF